MGRWDHDPETLQQAVTQTLGPVGGEIALRFRAMFGGIMGYAHDRPFASLSNAGLALKLPSDSRESVLAQGGAALRYKPDDPPSKTYTLLPESWLIDSGALRPVLMKSAAYVTTLPARKTT